MKKKYLVITRDSARDVQYDGVDKCDTLEEAMAIAQEHNLEVGAGFNELYVCKVVHTIEGVQQ